MVDGVTATLLLAATFTGVYLLGDVSPIGNEVVITPVSGVLFTIAFTLRRRVPVVAGLLTLLAGVLRLCVVDFEPIGTDLVVLVMVYSLAAYGPRWASLAGVSAAALAAPLAVARWSDHVTTNTLVIGSASVIAPAAIAWLLGDSMRTRRAYDSELEDRARRLERERDTQAQIAAAAERARIARELHDVVAHNVSVMVVQADGAWFALENNPEHARKALDTIAGTGRLALVEMRRLLGVLRSDATEGPLGPQPGIEALRELIRQVRETGLPVTFDVQGQAEPLPKGAALAAYRIVQEALTNTMKHGGPRANALVRLRYLPGVLELRVTDDGAGAAAPGDGQGHGLIGMRERVTMFGGSLAAGPGAGGGFEVAATLPLQSF
jgi:signal transduction histidine kinase